MGESRGGAREPELRMGRCNWLFGRRDYGIGDCCAEGSQVKNTYTHTRFLLFDITYLLSQVSLSLFFSFTNDLGA